MKSENVSSDEINDGEIEITFLKFNLTTVISELHRKIVLGSQFVERRRLNYLVACYKRKQYWNLLLVY